MLLECGGEVTVVIEASSGVGKLSEEGAIHVVPRDYEAGDLKEAFLAVAGTNVKEVNRRMADDAKKEGALLNVVDDPEQSDYIVPSLFRRGDLTVAISTGGTSPALARKIRKKLEQEIGEDYALLSSLIGEVRSIVKKKGILSAQMHGRGHRVRLLTELGGQASRKGADLLKRLDACEPLRAISEDKYRSSPSKQTAPRNFGEAESVTCLSNNMR
jgi:siroheme synthase-like protein